MILNKIQQLFQEKKFDKNLEWQSTEILNDPNEIRNIEVFSNENSPPTIYANDSTGKIFIGRLEENLNSLKIAFDFKNILPSLSSPSHIAIDALGKHLACCSNESEISILNVDDSVSSAQRVKRWRVPARIQCSVYCADQRSGSEALILGASSTPKIFLIDCRMGGKLCSQLEDCEAPSTSNSTAHLIRISNSCLILSAAPNRSLKLWDLRITNRPLRTIAGLPNANGALSSTIHVDRTGRILARTDASGSIHFEELASGKPIYTHKISAKSLNGNIPSKSGAIRFSTQHPSNSNGKDTFLVYSRQNKYTICDLREIFMHRIHELPISASEDIHSETDNQEITRIRWIGGQDAFVVSRRKRMMLYRLI